MITHLVFFRFQEQAGGRDAGGNMAHLQMMLEALPAAIPEIQSLTCGADRSRSPASYDFGLSSTFGSWEDLETYRVHPAHQKVVEFVKEVTSDRAVVDYEQD